MFVEANAFALNVVRCTKTIHDIYDIYIYIFTHVQYMSLHFTVQEKCIDWEHQALAVITEDGIDNWTVLFVFLQFVSLQVFGQSIVMPGAGSYFTSHSLYIKDWSHPQRSFFHHQIWDSVTGSGISSPEHVASIEIHLYTRRAGAEM